MWGSNSGWGQHDGAHPYPSSRRGRGSGVYQPSTSSSTTPVNSYNNQFQNQNTNQHQQSYHYQNQNKNKNKRHPPRAKPKDSENYKIPSCPKCTRYFDLNARCPLILSCRHMLCEECVRSFPVGNIIKCYVCDAMLKKRSSAKDVREVFDINYYVAGQIYYLKPHGPPAEITQNFSFQPAGMQLNHVAVKRDFKKPTSTVKQQRSTLYVCAVVTCKMEATLRCNDCGDDGIYCEKCSETLHSMASGLRTHQIFPLNLTNCSRHKMIEEFYCEDCKKNFCSYCILEEHKNHLYKQITKLEETDMEEFKELHDLCKRVFRNLKSALTKADLSLNKNDPPNIRKSISNSFAVLHANLQLIENNLLKKLTDASDSSIQNLTGIREELLSNMQAVDNLIFESQKILDNKSGSKLNVSVFLERMKNASKLPCYFFEENNSVEPQEKLQFDDVWRKIEEYFLPLTCSSKNFKLIHENELPDDYRVSDFSETASHRSISNKSFISEMSINKQNLTHCQSINKTQRTGNWINETNQGFVPKIKKKSSSTGSSSKSKKSVINQSIPRRSFDEKMQVIVTQLNNPDSIFVQPVKQRKVIDNLHESLRTAVRNLQVGVVDEPKINNLYIVKNYDRTRPNWCRGKVISTIEEDGETSFEIFYIDFGNIVVLKRSDFRYITPELVNVLPLAIECKLFNIYPVIDDWTEEINSLISQMLEGDVIMHILKNEANSSLQIDFFVYTVETEYSIRDMLLFTGLAKMFDHEHEPSTPAIEPTTRKEEVFSNIPKQLIPNTKHTVMITHVVDPHNFYVQLHSREHAKLIQNLSTQMSEYYKERKKDFVYNPKVGMGVAIKCTAGGIPGWYRARITDVKMGAGEVEVYLVDYGNSLWISWKQIKKLNEHFATETQQMAINIKLTQIEPIGEEWSQESITYLQRYKESKEILDMIVYSADTFMEVVLLKIFPGVITSINGEICKLGLAKSTGNLSSIVDWQDLDKEEKEENFTSSMLRTVQGGENEDEDECEDLNFRQYKTTSVEIIHIENPGCLYVHFSDERYKKRLQTVHVELQNFCLENELLTKDEWEIGETGIAFNQEDKQYYRVLIVEFDGEEYRVFSRDYAFYFKAFLDDLSTLTDELLQEIFLAYRCHFYGVSSIGKEWTLTATDYIKEILLHKKNVFFARIGPSVKINSFNSTPVVFWYKLLKPGSALEPSQVRVYNVNLQLSKKGLGLKSKSWNLDHIKIRENTPVEKREMTELEITRKNIKADGRKGTWLTHPPITEKNFIATITYIDECACIYFQSETGTSLAESIEGVMKIFTNYQPPKKVAWEINDRCSVKYHRDGQWYRGIVIGFTEDKEIKVCMIDYGNVEDVTTDEIRTEILFENEPAVAQKIQLHNIYPKNHKFSTSDIDFIHLTIVDKIANIEIVDFHEEPPTAIIKIDSLNVNDFLLKTGGNYSGILPLSDDSFKDDPDVLIEDDHSVELEIPRVYRHYKSKELPTDKYFNVVIINTIGYNKIVFQVTGGGEEDETFKSLSDEIEEQGNFQPQLLDFKENNPCIALYEEKWYRGNITKVVGRTLTVHFVDYGNVEEVTETDVREIKPEWLNFRLEQHTALLNGVEASDSEKKEIISETLLSYYDQIKCCEIVSENPLIVNLYDVDTMELSYADLIENGVF